MMSSMSKCLFWPITRFASLSQLFIIICNCAINFSDIGESNAMPRNKRSFSATFGSSYGAANKGGFPTKRPRGVSAASSSGGGQSSHRLPHINGGSDDPIVQYLADMVDIERQWLDMERQRAENERSMMMYMMQILQALVCPQQDEEEQETEVEG